ncbi:TPA: hypothetical protein QDB15_002111 [Burkholderia vietnamiensis]|uniref:hypothetical protein n=1 Tax=Burkholderia vietnamiensis TaxID=60552 RepID=UPI0015940776|nr:hypothetical protein [Burkholderia vietnamiensis]MCA8209634.1 hypothetical protein [Burkholderia vietnamiensis]HDR9098890.1 hypothetical protein [Burkholderia vietnamiensis]HDR9118346.1 hypothetical protein [Burkholderia vietnamiensis]HDR9166911.1 hypothetical protein [Burkholderia vietnamiensis]
MLLLPALPICGIRFVGDLADATHPSLPFRFAQHLDDVQSPEALALRADGRFEAHSRKECPGEPGKSP